MDLKTLLQNWFAIHGDFSTFDFSLFTNSGIPRQNYIDFCFYTIGFTGVPETSIVPSRHFEIVCNALAGLSIESVDDITIRKCLSAVGFKYRDIGCLALYTTYTSVSAMDMQSLLLQYLLNPNNLLIAAVTPSDSKVLLTLPQYLFYSYKNKETVTVEDLLALNLITFEHVPRTRQVYLVGSTFYSSLADTDAMSILKTVYSIVCNLFNPVMLKTAPDFAFLALNECTGKQKKTVEASFIKQLAASAAINVPLNQLMHCLGFNIPEVMYSLQHFGTLTAIDNDDKAIQLFSNGMLQTGLYINDLRPLDKSLDIHFDKEDFMNTFGGDNEPRTISIN